MFKTKNIYSIKERIVNDMSKSPAWGWYSILIIWFIIITMILSATPSKAAIQPLEFGSYLQKEKERLSDLYRLQKSIAICEGSNVENSIPNKLNNPGNLKAGGKTDSQGHTIYESEVQGYLAHLSLLNRRYWGKTPKEMNKRYATDPNWYKCVNFYYYGY